MKRVVTLLLSVSFLVAGSTAMAQDAKVAAEVDVLLGGIEYVPKAEEWTKLGPDAATVLRTIAGSQNERPSRRARAVSALAHFPTPETKAFLTGILHGADSPVLLQRKAMSALSFAYGADSLQLLQPYLANPNRRLRESAIRAVGTVASPDAKALLKQRLQVEDAKYLRETIQEVLK